MFRNTHFLLPFSYIQLFSKFCKIPGATEYIVLQTMVEIYKPPQKRISSQLMQKLQLFVSRYDNKNSFTIHVENTLNFQEDFPSTKQGREQDGNVIGITPNYKIGEQKPNSELNLGKTGSLPRGSGDYKMTYRQEDYKQTIIDPKVCFIILSSLR